MMNSPQIVEIYCFWQWTLGVSPKASASPKPYGLHRAEEAIEIQHRGKT
ncbi:MAG: hypothetical protein HYV65_00670 [Candidatus Spechtbacteria bacterium]|nr:hypothetical protein [Candidatus Spechtbacteria bacterium]